MIELNDDLMIGKGSERACYQHPNDPSLCIKVRYRVKRSRDESEREFEYATRFHRTGLQVPLALPIEWVETNLGKGLVFPLIRDNSGEISRSLGTVEDKVLLTELFDVFAEKLLANAISVTDLRLQNLVLQNLDDGPRIVMIDGYGYTNDFLKHVFALTRLITLKQTQRRLAKFKRNCIENGH